MNNVICRTVFKHSDFNYFKEDNTASAEISTLLKGRHDAPFSQIWNDSVDVGFVMDHQNGKVSIWTLTKTDKDASDEDTFGWRFSPYIRDPQQATQRLKDLRILIIND